MKIFIMLFSVLMFQYTILTAEEDHGLRLRDDDSSLNIVLPPPITDEELADPPPGEIRKLYVRDINEVIGMLREKLDAAPAGDQGQDSPWMIKFEAIVTGLEGISTSHLQRDVFTMFPKFMEVFDDKDGCPPYLSALVADVRMLVRCIAHTMAEHVIDEQAEIDNADLLLFVDMLCRQNFYSEREWEDFTKPIDSAGLMIMDHESVGGHLRALGWEKAKIFLSRDSVDVAFSRYETDGDGLIVLKQEYLDDKPAIRAEWQEIIEWVAEQEQASAP